MIKKKIAFLFLLVNTCFVSFSQNNNNSLLWEITGNGLNAPSYLFGSMHLTDQRVFDLPDSVVAKLAQCEVVAFELNLDSVSGELTRDIMKYGARSTIEDILSKNEIEEAKKRFQKEGFDIEDFEKKTIADLYRTYKKKKVKYADNNTFLDAYLHELAKQFNKPIIGIETYEEQINALSSMGEEEQRDIFMSIVEEDSLITDASPIDSLLSFYLNEDIDALFNAIHTHAFFIEDVLITKRNYVMDSRIDSLIRLHRSFICVGAGHLGGPDGLITLLQKRGYEVKPLHSPRTGYYKKLLPQNTTAHWVDIVDEENGYRVQMPGSPQPMNMYGAEMKGFMDFGTGHFYLTAAAPVKGKNKKEQSKSLEESVKAMGAKAKITSKKAVKYKQMQGYDLEMEMAGSQYYSTRIVSDSSGIYLLMIGLANKEPEEVLKQKFFNSLATVNRKIQGFELFKDESSGFQIYAPSNFRLTNEDNEEGVRRKEYSCIDYNLQASVNVACIDYEQGTYCVDVNSLYESSFDPVKTFFKSDPEYVRDINFKGYRARDYKLIAPDNTIMYFRYILRCSRLYLLIVSGSDDDKLSKLVDLFESFDFFTPNATGCINYMPEQGDFSVKMPGEVTEIKDSAYYTSYIPFYDYYAVDKNTNRWASVTRYSFSEYEYLKNDSAALAFFEDHAVNIYLGDSLCSKEIKTIDSTTVYSFNICFEKHPNLEKRVRVIINGRHYYILSSIDDKIDHSINITDSLFSSFQFLEQDTTFNVFISKQQKLFDNIASADSLIQQNAMKDFSKYNFTEDDTLYLQQLLQQHFIDDTAFNYTSRIEILDKLFELYDNTQNIKYIKANYFSMPDSGRVRVRALNRLSSIRTKESVELWKRFILLSRPVLKDPYNVYQCIGSVMYDSLQLMADQYPDMTLLAEDKVYKNLYYRITAKVLRENLIPLTNIIHLQDEALGDILTEYNVINTADPDDYYYSSSFYDMLYVLNQYPFNEETQKLNRTILSDSVTFYKTDALVYLLKNNSKVDKKAFKKYLEEPYNRNELYDELEKINRLDAFPASLKKQKKLAEGEMYSYANDDEIWPDKITLIEERKHFYEGEWKRFFLYKIYYDENDYYLGIAGPYPLNDKSLKSRGSRTGIIYYRFDEQKLGEELDKYLNKKEDNSLPFDY